MNAFVVEDVRILAVKTNGTIDAMVVHKHLVLGASSGKLLKERSHLGVAAIHEVNLEALCTELGKVRSHLLLFSVDLRPRHPENNANALFVCILNKLRNINTLAVLPDVERSAPAFIEDHIFNTRRCSKIDKALIGLGIASGIALVVKSIPPIPCHLARLHP